MTRQPVLYNIGSYAYEGGGGRTLREDVPAAPNKGVHYYAKIKTSPSGTRTIEFRTSADTNARKYTIRVENKFAGQYKSDTVDVKVEKGTVTVVAAGDQSYYLGEEVVLSGTNTDSKNVHLFLIGPNLPPSGGNLTAPTVPVSDNNPGTFSTVEVLGANRWEFRWKTAGLTIDPVLTLSMPWHPRTTGTAWPKHSMEPFPSS